MDGADSVEDQNGSDPHFLATLLLQRYAALRETMWVARVDLTDHVPGPRSWHRTHGTLIASGWLEPGFVEETNGLPKPVYRVTRAGHQECERLASLKAGKPE